MTESQFLKNYSEAQIANALKWESRFAKIAENIDLFQKDFLTDYLKITNQRLFWIFQFNENEVIARFYSRYLYFDGKQIWYYVDYNSKTTNYNYQRASPQYINHKYAAKYRDLVLKNGTTKNIMLFATSFTTDAYLFTNKITEQIFNKLAKKYFPYVHKQNSITFNLSEIPNSNFYTAYLRRFIKGKQRYYLSLLGAQLKQFNSLLDQQILKLIRGIRCPDYRLYNWLVSGNSLYRCQALKSQPLLISYSILCEDDNHETPEYMYSLGLHLLVSNKKTVLPWSELETIPKPKLVNGETRSKKYPLHKRYYAIGSIKDYVYNIISTTVDKGLPLNEVLAMLFSKPLKSIKAVGKVKVYDFGGAIKLLYSNDQWRRLFTGVTLNNLIPKNKKEWNTWKIIYNSFEHYDINDWTVLFKGIKQPFSNEQISVYDGIRADLSEILSRITNHGDYPNRCNIFLNFIKYHATLSQIKNIIDQYHDISIAIRDKLLVKHEIISKNTQWVGMLVSNNIKTPNGLIIKELLTPFELKEEADNLSHCVDGYYYETLSGDSRILSIQENNLSIATAEMCLETDIRKRSFKVVIKCWQFRGYKNRQPPLKAQEAFNWFLKQMQANRLEINSYWPDERDKIKNIEFIHRELSKNITQWINKKITHLAK